MMRCGFVVEIRPSKQILCSRKHNLVAYIKLYKIKLIDFILVYYHNKIIMFD